MVRESPSLLRHLSVTESSVTLPPDQGSVMPQPRPPPAFVSRFRLEDFLEKRREILLCARTYPIGKERNQLRQTARWLRNFCRNRRWSKNKALEGADSLAWPKTPQ